MSWQRLFMAHIEDAKALNGIYIYTKSYHADFVETLKSAVPSGLRLWEKDEKRWYIFDSYADTAVTILKRYFSLIDDQRGRAYHQEYSQQERAREQARERVWRNTNYQSSGPSAGAMHGFTSDHATLYVTSDAPPEVIRAAYKALAILKHPDKGGSLADMQSVNAAFDRLKKAGKA